MLDQVFHEFPHKEAFLFREEGAGQLTATSIKELTQELGMRRLCSCQRFHKKLEVAARANNPHNGKSLYSRNFVGEGIA